MTKHDLKELAAIGAELGAAKAENEAMRILLRESYSELLVMKTEVGFRGKTLELIDRIDAFLSQQPEPTETYTAVDMATAAAQGFRDGQAAVEQAAAQDEREVAAVIGFYEGEREPRLLSWNVLPNGEHRLYTRPAQTEQQPAFPVDSEAWLQEWARGKFTYTGAYKPRVLGQLYGNTDWALARALHSAIVSQLHAPIAQTAPQSDCEWCAGAGKDHFGEKCEHCQTAPQSEQINIDPLLNAGAALSNIAFNLAQRPGVTLDQHVCDLLSSARKRWDAARAALSAQGQSNGDS